jgi:hypothetical protein
MAAQKLLGSMAHPAQGKAEDDLARLGIVKSGASAALAGDAG